MPAMPSGGETKTVAIFNSSADTVEMLSELLSHHGYRTVTGHTDHVKSGEVDFAAFLEVHQPDAMVWDISPPYDRNWNFAKIVRGLAALQHCVFVLTTTHRAHLDKLAGEDTGAYEIVGKPYDLSVIVDAVDRGLKGAAARKPRAFGHGES